MSKKLLTECMVQAMLEEGLAERKQVDSGSLSKSQISKTKQRKNENKED